MNKAELEKQIKHYNSQLDLIAPKCAWHKTVPTYREALERERYLRILSKTSEVEVKLGV